MEQKKIWSIYLRLFHWSLVCAVCYSIYTIKWGDGVDDPERHKYAGYFILSLLFFRTLWGLHGDENTRWNRMIPGPVTLFKYVLTLGSRKPSHYLGHNPMAAMGAVTIMVILFIQAITGLFATDDILLEGPLCGKVSSEACHFATQIHYWNSRALYGIIAIHISALVYYLLWKKQNLIFSMVHGNARLPTGVNKNCVKGNLFEFIVFLILSFVAVALIIK